MKENELKEAKANVIGLIQHADREKHSPLFAMQLTQAALNAANALAVLSQIKPTVAPDAQPTA